MDTSKLEHYVGRLAPNWRRLNALLIAPHFYRRFDRLPRHPSDPAADYHDFLVDRMARNDWSDLHLRCVDKETAKAEAKRLAPNIGVPRTVDVLATPRCMPKPLLVERLWTHKGVHFVAKPTQGSGAVLFLDHFSDADVEMLYRATRFNHFYSFRETQYYRLEPKVIIEDNISNDGNLLDYKFFCSGGEILFLQIDFGRFTDHRRILLTPPDFKPMSVMLGAFIPPNKWELPDSFNQLCDAARALSTPFDFVRIDLYEVAGSPYFGEFTFTPGAGLEPFSDTSFSRELLTRIQTF
jgi:hypothetical protein